VKEEQGWGVQKERFFFFVFVFFLIFLILFRGYELLGLMPQQ